VDWTIIGPVIILLFGAVVPAAFYFVAQQHVGRTSRDPNPLPGERRDLNVPR
jgi:hypothetical protein